MALKYDKYVFFDIDNTLGDFVFSYAFYMYLVVEVNIDKLELANEMFIEIFSKLMDTSIIRHSIDRLFGWLYELKMKNEIKMIGLYTMSERHIPSWKIVKRITYRNKFVDWVSIFRKSFNKYLEKYEIYNLIDVDISSDECEDGEKKHVSNIYRKIKECNESLNEHNIIIFIDDVPDIIINNLEDDNIIFKQVTVRPYNCLPKYEVINNILKGDDVGVIDKQNYYELIKNKLEINGDIESRIQSIYNTCDRIISSIDENTLCDKNTIYDSEIMNNVNKYTKDI